VRRKEVIVRMSELSASRNPGDVLVSIGLGSCVAVALVDAERSVAGLAHVLLPEGDPTGERQVGKFANTAVPALVERLVGLGASRPALRAALVGGARMFSVRGGADVGSRNVRAARNALDRAQIAVGAAATGGASARSTSRVRRSSRRTSSACSAARTRRSAARPRPASPPSSARRSSSR
jgi:chemotaxis protein CheD